MRKAAVITLVLLALGGPGASTAQAHYIRQHHGESGYHYANRVVQHARTGITWIKTHPTNFKLYRRYREALSDHEWLLRFGKDLQARYAPVFTPPHLADWLCIHRYEGSWDDPGAPYYGGLQMDWNFMQAYGRHLLETKGTADHWTPLEQMWVAENALRAGRGFYPWPNTARMCGLI